MKDDREWYLPDRDSMEAIGPVTTEDLIQRIKSGSLHKDEFVWGSHFSDDKWRRISEVEELLAPLKQDAPKLPPPPAIMRPRKAPKEAPAPRLEFSEEGEYGRENVYRRFPRAPLEVEVIIRNSRQYHRATSVDISEKGLQLQLADLTAYHRGEEVVITIRNAPGIGTFSAPGVVMRVLTEGKQQGYGVFFLRLNPLARRRISAYVIKQLQAGVLVPTDGAVA